MKKTKKTLNFPPDFFTPEHRTLRKKRLLPLGTSRDLKLPTIRATNIEKHNLSPSYSSNEEVEVTPSFRSRQEVFNTTLVRGRNESGRSNILRSYLSPSFSAAMSPVLLSPIMSPRSSEAKNHLPHLKPLMHNSSSRSTKGNLYFLKESPRLPQLETQLKTMNVTFSMPRNREVSYPAKPYSM